MFLLPYFALKLGEDLFTQKKIRYKETAITVWGKFVPGARCLQHWLKTQTI